MKKNISRKVTSRALLYIRTLEGLIKENVHLVSSKHLAAKTGLSDVQIRKDISSFGKVGTPRVGYSTAELKNILENFILQQQAVRLALFGVGNLGTAIMRYPGFQHEKIKLVAAFDPVAGRVGKKINGVVIHAPEDAPAVIRRTGADIGIIAVPPEASQEVADLMVLSGLKGIMNFSPTSITVPKNIFVKDIDLTIEFLALFCSIHRS